MRTAVLDNAEKRVVNQITNQGGVRSDGNIRGACFVGGGQKFFRLTRLKSRPAANLGYHGEVDRQPAIQKGTVESLQPFQRHEGVRVVVAQNNVFHRWTFARMRSSYKRLTRPAKATVS